MTSEDSANLGGLGVGVPGANIPMDIEGNFHSEHLSFFFFFLKTIMFLELVRTGDFY